MYFFPFFNAAFCTHLFPNVSQDNVITISKLLLKHLSLSLSYVAISSGVHVPVVSQSGVYPFPGSVSQRHQASKPACWPRNCRSEAVRLWQVNCMNDFLHQLCYLQHQLAYTWASLRYCQFEFDLHPHPDQPFQFRDLLLQCLSCVLFSTVQSSWSAVNPTCHISAHGIIAPLSSFSVPQTTRRTLTSGQLVAYWQNCCLDSRFSPETVVWTSL